MTEIDSICNCKFFSMDMQYAFQFIVADMDNEKSSLLMKEK